MTIKVYIHDLGNKCEFEIKRNNEKYILLVLKSKSDFDRDNGKIWHAQTKDEKYVDDIQSLIKYCYENPSKPKRITILDGIYIVFEYTFSENKIKLIIKDHFEKGSKEVILMCKFLAFTDILINDADFKNYLKSIKPFFD